MSSYLKNQFLIAMPGLSDPFFHQSVIYLIEHSKQGAMGFIINKPTQISLAELLSHIHIEHQLTSKDDNVLPVLFGGPVNKDQGMVLHEADDTPWQQSSTVSDQLRLTTSTDILKKIGQNEGPEKKLIILGYASWQQGQLEREIAENSWLTAQADPMCLFNAWQQDYSTLTTQLLDLDIHLLSATAGHA